MGGIEVAELADHFFREPVAEIFLIRIASEVLKGQDRQRDLVGLLRRDVPGTPSPNGRTRYQDCHDRGSDDGQFRVLDASRARV